MKAPSLAVSLLFAIVAVVAVLVGGAGTILDILQAVAFQFVAAVSLVTSVWRLWQEYMSDVEVHTMDREIQRSSLHRAFWG